MAQPTVQDYILDQRSTQVSDQDIITMLVQTGWKQSEVQAEIDRMAATPPASAELTTEQQAYLSKFSFGAIISYFYSGFMHIWWILAIELAINFIGIPVFTICKAIFYLHFLAIPKSASFHSWLILDW